MREKGRAMAHKTLYREFRPRKFSDVSGQDQVTSVLEKQIEKKSPGHAYLFCGSRGTGKTTTARILANALNCQHPVNGNPCGECEICRSFERDTFVDVLEIDAASNNGVDNIRDIREKAALLPVQGAYKVYIIDEVHMLSQGAFNALLKTLEEPPEHAIFILATTEFRKIPRTIVSRCQHFNFKRISEADIVARLQHVADAIGATCEEGALDLLASQSDGALRDALSMLDQCLAGRDSLTRDDVQKTLGLSDRELLKALCDNLQMHDAHSALRIAREILDTGTSPAHILQDAIIEMSTRLAASPQDPALLRSVDTLIAAHEKLRFSTVPQAVLSAALVRSALPETDTGAENLALRVRQLEDAVSRLMQGGAPMPHQQVARSSQARSAPPAPAEAPAAPAQQPAVPAGSELERFRSVLAQENPGYGPPAEYIFSLERKGEDLIALTDESHAGFVQMLSSPEAAGAIGAALEAVYGKPAPRLRIVSSSAMTDTETRKVTQLLAKEVGGEENVEINNN